MTATDEAGGDAAKVVTPTALRQTFRQGLDRLAFVEAGAVDDDELALARRDRIEMFQCHCSCSLPQTPVDTSMD